MKLEWSPPRVNDRVDAVDYTVKVTLEIHEIRGHPDRFLPEIGDTYRGISIVRDDTIPRNEIHIIDGGRRIVLKAKE